MKKTFLIIPVLIGVGVIVISIYLSPNDLASCNLARPNSTGKCSRVDAIVTVSGGNTSKRVQESIELYKNDWADLLVFSGAARDTSGPSNAEVMKKQAIAAGVPKNVIITEDVSTTTKQNAEKTEKLFAKHDIHRVILVTSPYHQRRASLEFRSVAGPDITILNHPTSHDSDWSAFWWLTPRGWWLAGGELVKIIAFHGGKSQ